MQANPLQEALIRSCTDLAYRKRLIDNPRSALAEAGVTVPQGVELVIHVASDHHVPLVLPGKGTGPGKAKVHVPDAPANTGPSGFSAVWHGKTLVVTGRIDIKTSGDFKKALMKGSGQVEVDFSKVTFLSSVGLASLLVAQKQYANWGVQIRLIDVPSEVRNVLELSGFDKLFHITDAMPQ
jgi:anti-sigma B factor antagonist